MSTKASSGSASEAGAPSDGSSDGALCGSSAEDHVPLPGPLKWRALALDDVEGWLALLRRIARVDEPDWVEQRADLEQALLASKNDARRDTIAGFDDQGAVRAFGRVSMNPGSHVVHGAGGVDPEWRRRGLGTSVLGWQEARARERLRETTGTAVKARGALKARGAGRSGDAGVSGNGGVFRNYVEERNPSQLALLRARGGTAVRYFTEMTRSLEVPPPEIAFPAELELVSLAEDTEGDVVERVRLAHNDAFQDHWGSEPRDQESWRFTVDHPKFRADWSLALIDPASGDVVAYQIASCDPNSKELLGHSEGYTDLLGVRRAWRGRGLAPALLAEAMKRYRTSGMEHAGLGVDTDNPSGALGLYERMGYEPTQRSIAFDLPLSLSESESESESLSVKARAGETSTAEARRVDATAEEAPAGD